MAKKIFFDTNPIIYFLEEIEPFASKVKINKYNDFLKDLDFLKCFINDKIAFRSIQLRAKYKGLKLADSLQLAFAIESNCDAFLTNDIQLKQVSEVNVVCLGDL